MCPDFAGRRDGGPWGVSKALGCFIGGDFVGFLVDGILCAEEQRVLLFLRLEMLNRLPEVVVCVTRLESC